MMNATAIAFDRGAKCTSPRATTKPSTRFRPMEPSHLREGMGVATGIAFDRDENLFVGDRSGTIFKIARDRQIFVFATLEPSISAIISPSARTEISSSPALHLQLRLGLQGRSTRQRVRFLPRPGTPARHAFDIDGNLYVAASLAGKRGIVKITPQGKASLQSRQRPGRTSLAPNNSAILATSFSGPPPTGAVHHIAWGIEGLSLPPV